MALEEQDHSITNSSTTGVVALTCSAGDLIIVDFVIRNGAALVGVTDTQLQTYVETSPTFGLGAANVGQYYFPNAAAGATTITVTAAGADTIIVNAKRLSGMHLTAPLVDTDTTAAGTTGTNHPAGDTGVDAIAGQFIDAVWGQHTTIEDETPETGFTQSDMSAGNNRAYFSHRFATGTETAVTGAYDSASSHTSLGIISVFAEAAGGGGGGTVVPSASPQRNRRSSGRYL